jgi:hypothetical protein
MDFFGLKKCPFFVFYARFVLPLFFPIRARLRKRRQKETLLVEEPIEVKSCCTRSLRLIIAVEHVVEELLLSGNILLKEDLPG